MRKREDKEALEFKILSPFAKKAAGSKGRKIREEKCEFRTDFQRDRDRIIHSRAFRRLKHKTQVFIAPFGDHYRTRLTHTLEVSQIARTIASSLALNEDLTEAISLGHDLGHTPFGHDGENIIREVYSKDFKHNKQSLRVVDILEKNERRRGLNLTEEVRDGILNHTGAGTPMTLEGQVVKTADRIAYINHDIDDAIRSGVITEDDLPKEWTRVLGNSNTARINSLVVDMIEASDGKPAIAQSPAFEEAMLGLRSYMFENIYADERVKAAAELEKVRRVVTSLYKYYLKNPGEISSEYMELIEAGGIETVAKDMVAGMTDNFAEEMYGKLFSPKC